MRDLLTGRFRVKSLAEALHHDRSQLRRTSQSSAGSVASPSREHRPAGSAAIYRDEAAMAAFDRPLEDPLVEKLLVAAILRINAEVKTEAQAKLAVAALRKTMSHPDKLTANRQTLDLLRDGAKVVLNPGEDAKTVHFIEFDPARQNLNDFTATNQYRVQGVKQCRDDTVLLVNGIPLVVAEYKSYVASGKDWREAVHQLHRYQRQAPLMLTPNVFCVAADEDEFRYGTVLFHDASKDDIERHLDIWGRWLSLYPEQHGWWNEPEAAEPDDPLEVPVKGLLRLKPAHLLDFLQHFVVFETKKGKTTKKIARYQQFEAVNEIVDRTVSLIGHAGRRPGPHRPHLAHAGVRQVAHDDLRRPEAAAASGAQQPHRADRGRPARPEDATLRRLRRLRLSERREGAWASRT